MQINEEKRTLHPEKRVYIQTFVTCVCVYIVFMVLICWLVPYFHYSR